MPDSNWWENVADDRDRSLRGPEKLEIGRKYDTTKLSVADWTTGDGTGHQGYHAEDYFTPDGVYLGPDQHGIEPLFLL
jgi:hypothetical protein